MAQDVGMVQSVIPTRFGWFFEGSIPTCACLHLENFFVTCSCFLWCIGLCKPDHSKPDSYIPTTDKQAFTGQSFHLEIEGYLW